jgi:hypothetical protein
MRHFAFCLAVIALLSIIPASAELRPPNSAEKQVLEKYENIINKILDQFQSDDWDENVDFAVGDDVNVSGNAGRPLDVDEMFQRTYRVRNNSQRWNSIILPAMTKMQNEQDMSKKVELGKPLQALTAIEVEVHFNSAVSIDTPPPGSKSYIQIPGTAMAYHATANPYTHGAAYVLLFGNWQGLKYSAEQSAYQFHFTHPRNTPFIENVAIQIYGADDRIQELLKKIDWNAVNAGMTR